MPDELVLTPDLSGPRKAPRQALVDALVASPDQLVALMRELEPSVMERVVSQAFYRAISDETRAAVKPVILQMVADEAPGRVTLALDKASENYEWKRKSGGCYHSLLDVARLELMKSVVAQIQERAAEMGAKIACRMQLVMRPGCDEEDSDA